MHDKKFDESIRFVARHYRPGIFDPSKAWRRMGISTHLRRPSRRIAAAVAAAVVLTASACFFTFIYPNIGTSAPAPQPAAAAPAQQAPAAVVRRIEFADATLAEVAAEIRRVYGVRITNLPDTDTRLTLSYEGSATDLITTINILLDSDIQLCDD